MEKRHELLEHVHPHNEGNYYPHGKFESSEAAHKAAKDIGLKKHHYVVKEHELPYWVGKK